MALRWLTSLLAAIAAVAHAQDVIKGPHDVTYAQYDGGDVFDSTSSLIDVWFPTTLSAGEKVPLIVYAHGSGGGGMWF